MLYVACMPYGHLPSQLLFMRSAQGTELLRRGEPAPSVYIVSSGQCVLRSCHLGLAEETVAEAYMFDLAPMKVKLGCM